MTAMTEDQGKVVRLARLRRAATGVLAGLVAVFLITLTISDPPGWVLFIRAVAEAGMVGGLADWFAVTAIFRHPLGIPIPHTALLRTRKDEAAENIGKFIRDYILVPDEIAGNLARVNPARVIGGWLVEKGNAAHVAELLMAGVDNVLTRDAPELRTELRKLVETLLHDSNKSSALGRMMAEILRGGLGGAGFSQVVVELEAHIEANRADITQLVHDNSRWWISAPVDRQVANLIVDAVLSLLEDLRNPASASRKAFEGRVFDVLERLETSGALNAFLVGPDGASDADRLAGQITEAIGELFATLRPQADEKGARAEIEAALTRAAERLGRGLLEDPAVADSLNARIASVAEDLAHRHRDTIGGYVAATLRNWDTDLLIERFETEVGPDLQFVRINGALLGAMIGGGIFALERLLGG